jgi:pimeloyl-ACP methyl ester carboxylesterase
VAQEIALRRADRLLSLTLEDTGPGFGSRSRDDGYARYTAMRNRMADEHGMEAVAGIPSVFPSAPYATAERREEERRRLASMSPDGFVGASICLREWPGTKDRVSKIATSTLVICGELDTFLLPGSRHLAAKIPGATLEIIPGAAHSPQYERPDLFNASLRAHLERVRSGRLA